MSLEQRAITPSEWLSGEQVRLCSGHPKVHFEGGGGGGEGGGTVGPAGSFTNWVGGAVVISNFVAEVGTETPANTGLGLFHIYTALFTAHTHQKTKTNKTKKNNNKNLPSWSSGVLVNFTKGLLQQS